MKVVSFYTQDSEYERRAPCLIKSLKKFGLDYCVEGVKSFGSWVVNCAYKPKFIKEKLQQFPGKRIIWTDVDSELLEFPSLMLDIQADFGYHRLINDEVLSGTLFFQNNVMCHHLLDMWIESCSKHPREWDQKTLSRVIAQSGASVYQLPIEYCYIFDINKRYANCYRSEPVFIHYQQSRLGRHQGGK